MFTKKLLPLFFIVASLVSAENPAQIQLMQQNAPFHDQSLVDLFREKQIRLIVIRHGEGIHNLTETMTSSRSPGVSLTEKGRNQVKLAVGQLREHNIEQMYISPVYRTLQTAQILGDELNVHYSNMVVEDRLREQFFGDFENLSYDEFAACFSAKEDQHIKAVTNGESGQDLFNRTHDLLWDIASRHSNITVLLVTHAFNCCQISKCLTGSFQGIPMQAQPKIYEF